MSKLRGKLETAMPDRRFIHTHPGFGYRFQPQPARESSGSSGAAGEPADVSDITGESADHLLRNVHIGTVGDS